MVATSFWGWRPGDGAHNGLGSFLTELLRVDIPGAGWILYEADTPVDGGALRVGAVEESERAVERLYAVSDRKPGWIPSRTEQDAAAVIRTVEDDLTAIAKRWDCDEITSEEAFEAFRVRKLRVFLSPERGEWLFGGPGEHLPFYVCVDVSLSHTEIDGRDEQLYLVSTTVWSDHPNSTQLAPLARPHDEANNKMSVDGVLEHADFYLHTVRSRARDLLKDCLASPNLPIVRNTPYVAPMYWIVSGEKDACRTVAAALLNTTDLDAAPVSGAVLAGSLPMYRRMLGGTSVNVPFYAILPRVAGVPEDKRAELFALQEEHTAHAVLAMTELELQVATLAQDIETNLSLWEHNVELYGVTATAGSGLWDAVAMYLPIARRRRLDKAHSIISLIHETMLQSTSDLAYIGNLVEDAKAHVVRTVNQLQASFDNRIAEKRAGPNEVSAAMSDDGYLGYERRRIDRASAELNRIRGNYQGLFDAITKAFDDRRTRETDRFSWSNLVLAAVLAVFGVVTVLTATFKFDTDASPSWQTVLRVMTWVLGASVVGAGLWVGRVLLGRRLGRKNFRRAYKPLRDYLRKVSTVELNELKRQLDKLRDRADGKNDSLTVAEYANQARQELNDALGTDVALGSNALTTTDQVENAVWNTLDTHLSHLLETHWTAMIALGTRRRSNKVWNDLKALENNVGQWTMRTMLLTERPTNLCKFKLPRLMTTYCALSGSDRAMPAVDNGHRANAVSQHDIQIVVTSLGFDRRDAGAFYRWLSAERQTIDAAIAEVNELGLHNGMDRHARCEALTKIGVSDHDSECTCVNRRVDNANMSGTNDFERVDEQ